MVDLYRDTVTSFANHAVKFLSFTLLDVTRPRDLTPRASEAPAWRSIQPSQIISLGV